MTRLTLDAITFLRVSLQSRMALAAEHLFLRKQLALYRERQVTPRRADPATRVALVLRARVIAWKPVLTAGQPETLLRWHRTGGRLFWRWKSRPRRRPRSPRDRQHLIVAMARANPTWGEERIANDLPLQLGIHVSPRTVARSRPKALPPRHGPRSPRWAAFVRNHAHAVRACDCCVTVTAGFRLVYVFIV